MNKPYDLNSVAVKRTSLSQLQGVTHLAIAIEGLPSLYVAEKLRVYLQAQQDISSVGGIYRTDVQAAFFFCFVWKQFPTDAENYVRGILGPQAMKFAFKQ